MCRTKFNQEKRTTRVRASRKATVCERAGNCKWLKWKSRDHSFFKTKKNVKKKQPSLVWKTTKRGKPQDIHKELSCVKAISIMMAESTAART